MSKFDYGGNFMKYVTLIVRHCLQSFSLYSYLFHLQYNSSNTHYRIFKTRYVECTCIPEKLKFRVQLEIRKLQRFALIIHYTSSCYFRSCSRILIIETVTTVHKVHETYCHNHRKAVIQVLSGSNSLVMTRPLTMNFENLV